MCVRSLEANSLTGTLPSTIMALPALQRFSLGDNSLRGELPPAWCAQVNLLTLHLYHNAFSGTIPDTAALGMSLVLLDLSENNFDGTIPSSLANLAQLQVLQMQSNNLVGTLPVWLGQLSNLYELNLANNGLTGGVPSAIGSMSSLANLILSGNFFESISACSVTSPSLQSVDLSGNLLSDVSALNWSSGIVQIDLSFNYITGPFPDTLCAWAASQPSVVGNTCSTQMPSECSQLVLASNMLSGPLPRCLGVPGAMLQVLDLSYNYFHGSVPALWSLMSQLLVLTLSYNCLAGALEQAWLGGMAQLVNLDVSQNFLSGTVPRASVYALSKLVILSYASNCGILWRRSGTTACEVATECCNVSVCLQTPQRPPSHQHLPGARGQRSGSARARGLTARGPGRRLPRGPRSPVKVRS